MHEVESNRLRKEIELIFLKVKHEEYPITSAVEWVYKIIQYKIDAIAELTTEIDKYENE